MLRFPKGEMLRIEAVPEGGKVTMFGSLRRRHLNILLFCGFGF